MSFMFHRKLLTIYLLNEVNGSETVNSENILQKNFLNKREIFIFLWIKQVKILWKNYTVIWKIYEKF